MGVKGYFWKLLAWGVPVLASQFTPGAPPILDEQ